MVSAWLGGAKSGFLATFLSGVISTYFFIYPLYSLKLELTNSVRVLLFLLEGILISVLFDLVQTKNQRLEDSLLKLRHSEQRFSQIAQTSQDVFWIAEPKSNCSVYVSPAYEQIWGRTCASLQANFMEWIEAIHPLDRERVQTAFFENALKGKYDEEYRIVRPDGTIRWIRARGFPIQDESGATYRVAGIAEDITQRKQAESALKQSEARFKRLAEANLIGVIFWDINGNINDANDTFLQMVGYTKEDLEQGELRWSDMTPPEYCHLDQQAIEQIKISGAYTPFEKEYLRKDGSRVPILIGGTFLEETQDQGVSFVLDLTSPKQLENDLRASEAKFRRLFDSNIIGIIFPDLSGKIIDSNDAFLQMVGYTREELQQGKVRWDTMTPPEYDAVDDYSRQELINTGVSSPFEKEYIRKDGTRIPILLASAMLEGSKENAVTFVLNISDRKLAEAQLRESEARFRHLADTAPVLIWMSGTDKLYNYFNQTWLDFTGRTLEQEMGNGWTQGVHPDDLPRCLDTYINAFDACQEFTMEYRLQRFDGEYCWIVDKGIPRLTSDGKFLGYIGSCLDISDRKFAEAEIQQFNQILEQRVKERTAQLETVNQELESFSYSVSHDLRAPLRHINGYVELLQKRTGEALDETSRRYLNTIVQTSKHAGTLIDNLLAFSRMGRTAMRCIPLNMNQLIQEVQRDLEPEIEGRTIAWQIQELPQVPSDPAMLRLVWGNLLENALKYSQTRTNAKIEIGSFEKEEEVVFFVRDNGVGFDMRYVHKLFGVFQRLHSNEQFAGTGIGLANVRRIIHRHGGQTWAEGVIDSGATFYFSLPKLQRGE